MQQPLYLEDSYTKECTAKVLSVKDGKFVILDTNLFYPQGGGQPCDTGTLRATDEREVKVIFAGKFDDIISHQVEPENVLKQGDVVTCTLDWNKRYILMRMHTAAHILSAILVKETGALITGNQLGEDQSRIDFNTEHFDKEKFESYITEANQLISQGATVSAETKTRDEVIHDTTLFKLAKGFPENIKDIRILTIDGIDKQADGGTHVKNIKEIGKIKLLSISNKGANNKRVYFTLE